MEHFSGTNETIITWPYTDQPTDRRPHHRATNVYSYTFYLVWEPRRKLIAHQCWDQLTVAKQGIRWPVSPDRIAGSGVDPSRLSTFFQVIRWHVTSFQMIVGSSLFVCTLRTESPSIFLDKSGRERNLCRQPRQFILSMLQIQIFLRRQSNRYRSIHCVCQQM